mgnify:CR=1 FL=1
MVTHYTLSGEDAAFHGVYTVFWISFFILQIIFFMIYY